MRILVVSQYFWPETFRINELVEMLQERGHDVTILTGVPNYPAGSVFPEFEADPTGFLTYRGMPVVRVPMMVRGESRLRLAMNYLTFAVSASVIGLWKLRRDRFDVVFAYEPSPITVGIPAMAVRRFKRAPSCMWVLDLWPETPQALGMLPYRPLVRVAQWGVRRIYRSMDLVLVQSPGFVASVRQYAPPGARIEYFPSWADAVFDGQLPDPAPEVPIDPGAFTVVFAGNIGEAQDFGTVLDAAEMLSMRGDIRFVIVGDGRQSAWLDAEVRRRGLSGSFLLLGRHPVDRMPEFFAHADALLVSLKADPVFAKTIPAKVQAYMAAGIPVVALLDAEGADAVRRWECGTVAAPGDGAGLATAIAELADAPQAERVRMGDNGRRGAATEFHRTVLVDRLIGWLAELAEGGRRT